MQSNVGLRLRRFIIITLELLIGIFVLIFSSSPDTPTGLLNEFVVADIRFFYEGGEKVPNQRIYENVFYRGTSPFIYYEMDLRYPAPEQRIDFTILTVFLKPDGSIYREQNCASFIEVGWTGSIQSCGMGGRKSAVGESPFGESDPSLWESGTYTAVFYINNHEVGRKVFIIGDLLSNINVTGIKFYEIEGREMFQAPRIYENKFIAYEVNLHYPASGQRIDFEIHTVYLNPDGSLFQEWDCPSFIEPGRTQSFLTGASGWSEPGAWGKGQYTAVFYINNYEIGRESFTIE
jgi:hypothetical protein